MTRDVHAASGVGREARAARSTGVNGIPEREALLQRARELTPRLREAAAQTEAARNVSDDVMNAFAEAGLFRILQPREFGGYEMDMGMLIAIASELARGCPSSAWVYAIGASHTYLAALFPSEVQDEIWANKTDVFIAGSYSPGCVAEKVGGGYRITGDWPFASGIDHASWALVGALLPCDDDTAPPAPGFLLLSVGDCTIADDWYTTGLCGTGSKRIVLENVFVPGHRKLGFGALLAGKSPGSARHDKPLYRLPFISTTPVGIISTGIGAVQGSIDEFLESVAGRTTRGAALGAGASIAHFGSVQSRFAEATACIDCARMLLHRTIDDAHAVVAAGEEVSVAQRIRNRRDHAFSVRLTEQAMAALDSVSGGKGLYKDSVLQRARRDVHAVGKHVSFNWDAVSTMYGQHAFSLDIRGQY